MLHYSTTKLAEMLKKKETTSVELVQMYIDQIIKVNPSLNAMSYDCFSDALEQAKNVI